MKWRNGLIALLCLAGTAQAAEQLMALESLAILKRMSNAARQLNYSGVYLYQRADSMETFRLFHAADANGEQERRESLDGQPREFVRNNDQIVCYVPDGSPFALDKRTANKFFPSIIGEQMVDVLANYSFKRVGIERVAGYECQSILLEPQDKLRHAHKLCIEPNSGLLLKSTMYGLDKREKLEQFSFTQLAIGTPVDRKLLQPTFLPRNTPPGWPLPTPIGLPPATPTTRSAFSITELPSGFKLIRDVMSLLPGRQLPVQHLLYSDGVVTVSVFIERMEEGNGGVSVPVTAGRAVNFYSRQMDNWRITAVGEVPLRTVQLFAQGVTLR